MRWLIEGNRTWKAMCWQALEHAGNRVGEKVVAMAATSTGVFLRQLLKKLYGLSSLDLDSAEQLLRICVRWVWFVLTSAFDYHPNFVFPATYVKLERPGKIISSKITFAFSI